MVTSSISYESLLAEILSSTSNPSRSTSRSTLHTTTSARASTSITNDFVASTSSQTTALGHLTGVYTASTALGQLTGAQTINDATATYDSGTYTLVTQNGGLCRMSLTGTIPPTYATYAPGTILATLDRRASASLITSISQDANATPAGRLPIGTTNVPVSDVPECAAATASGAFVYPSSNSSSSMSSISTSDDGLTTGQKAGVAVGVVAAVAAIIIAVVYYMWKKGGWRQGTQAQNNIWGSSNESGGTNAGMTEVGNMVSGIGLREVLFNGRSGFR